MSGPSWRRAAVRAGIYLALGLVLPCMQACGAGATQSVNSRLTDDVEFDDGGGVRHAASERVRAGEAKLVEGDLEGALMDFRAAIEADASDVRAHLDVGLVLELGEDFAGAEAAYRQALELDTEFPEALNNLGLLLRDQERPAEAVPLLRRAVELRPSYGEAYLNLGLAHEDLSDNDSALDAYRRAARLAPDDAYPRVSLGLLLKRMGQDAEARTEFSRARRLARGDAATLLEIGSALRQLGDSEGAVHALQDAVEANAGQTTPTLASELALAQWGAHDRDAAGATLAEAIAVHPEAATLHFLLARLRLEQGNTEEARASFRRVLELDGNSERGAAVREWLQANP